MRTKLLKGAGIFSVLGLCGLLWITGTKAQTAGAAPKSSSITTNWIGCVVVGKSDPIDSLARGLYPTTMREIQLGLRSDGVVVWRDSETR